MKSSKNIHLTHVLMTNIDIARASNGKRGTNRKSTNIRSRQAAPTIFPYRNYNFSPLIKDKINKNNNIIANQLNAPHC